MRTPMQVGKKTQTIEVGGAVEGEDMDLPAAGATAAGAGATAKGAKEKGAEKAAKEAGGKLQVQEEEEVAAGRDGTKDASSSGKKGRCGSGKRRGGKGRAEPG